MRSVCQALNLLTTTLGYIVAGGVNSIFSFWIPSDLNDGHLDYIFYIMGLLSALSVFAFTVVSQSFEYHVPPPTGADAAVSGFSPALPRAARRLLGKLRTLFSFPWLAASTSMHDMLTVLGCSFRKTQGKSLRQLSNSMSTGNYGQYIIPASVAAPQVHVRSRYAAYHYSIYLSNQSTARPPLQARCLLASAIQRLSLRLGQTLLELARVHEAGYKLEYLDDEDHRHTEKVMVTTSTLTSALLPSALVTSFRVLEAIPILSQAISSHKVINFGPHLRIERISPFLLGAPLVY